MATPQCGLVLPGGFIPVAEAVGLIQSIGEWILRRACRDARGWREAGTPVRVGLNLSPSQVRQRDLSERIREILTEVGLRPAERTRDHRVPVPAAGLHVAPRRTGRPRHPLRDRRLRYRLLLAPYLNRFPINCIKIDRSFIR